MKIHNCPRGELEWYQLRAGKITASEANALLTPQFKARTGDSLHTYLCAKVAERFSGVRPPFSTWAAERSQFLEEAARKWYICEFDEELTDVGFCESDDGLCGCSPDALIDEDGGLEIKCPEYTNHVRYLLDGILPKDYAVQVHFSMYVTGRQWWQFVSYHRKLPAFVFTVHRDEKIIEQIHAAVTGFHQLLEEAVAKIEDRKIA